MTEDTAKLKNDLIFLKKRVAELSKMLDEMSEDHDRLFFVAATFGKYMEYYTSKNDYMFDHQVLEDSIMSVEGELVDWFQENGISDFEQDMIANYIDRIQKRMTHLEQAEREKLR